MWSFAGFSTSAQSTAASSILPTGSELDRILSVATAGGGNFHPTLKTRVGQRFGRALVASTLGGRTSFSESFRLLGIRKPATLHEFAASLEVAS